MPAALTTVRAALKSPESIRRTTTDHDSLIGEGVLSALIGLNCGQPGPESIVASGLPGLAIASHGLSMDVAAGMKKARDPEVARAFSIVVHPQFMATDGSDHSEHDSGQENERHDRSGHVESHLQFHGASLPSVRLIGEGAEDAAPDEQPLRYFKRGCQAKSIVQRNVIAHLGNKTHAVDAVHHADTLRRRCNYKIKDKNHLDLNRSILGKATFIEINA
jgi:hypothetical protein